MGVLHGNWSRWWARPVTDDVVECELRGPVHTDECRACTWLLAIEDAEGTATEVRCRPDAARLAARGTGI